MLTEIDLPALPQAVTALHFGSFSLAEEPCGSAFEALMQREHRDRVISLDVNVRPTLIKNRDGYLARIDRLAAMSDIVKLSEEDLAWLVAWPILRRSCPPLAGCRREAGRADPRRLRGRSPSPATGASRCRR